MSSSSKYDAAIVGAGPAGMAAAVALAEHGARTLIVDDQPSPGGQIWRNVETNTDEELLHALGSDYRDGQGAVKRFRAAGIDYRPSTQMWQIEPEWRLFTKSEGQARFDDARALLLATGAQERPAPIKGWTLPGVMTVGGAQILLKTAAQFPSEPVWIVGTGPLPLLYMTQLLELGGKVAGFIDTAPKMNAAALASLPAAVLRGWGDLRKGLRWLARLRRDGVPVYRGVSDIVAVGEDRLRQIRFRSGSGEWMERPASVLLIHEGIVPSVHATMAAGCDHVWSAAESCFVPKNDGTGKSTKDGLYVAGDGAGIVGAKAAAVQGRITGLSMAIDLGCAWKEAATAEIEQLRRNLASLAAARPFLNARYPAPDTVSRLDDDAIVCRCEEVTAGTLREIARTNRGGPDEVKAFTRAGMGPCQGRQCGYNVARILADSYEKPIEDVGFFRIRPPLRPITIGELASMAEEGAP